jgi:hypothetical protein
MRLVCLADQKYHALIRQLFEKSLRIGSGKPRFVHEVRRCNTPLFLQQLKYQFFHVHSVRP